MANVTLKNIKKIYDKKVVAVEDFNLEIQDKEFIVLVGPSGCGKSTTLRMVAGLEEITEGELYIEDRLVNDVAPKDRNIAMVFQSYALYPHMTVFENMAFSLRLRKEPKAIVEKKVRDAAEVLGITDLLERTPKALSGGQRQRVAIGRAIVRNPKVFLMDEPLSNLDAKLRNLMRAELIKLRKRINTTFIYVTHDQTEAMTLGDRIVVMSGGVIQQIGTPQEIFDHPANIFVATFIGSPQMNLFDARLQVQNDEYYVMLEGKRVELPEEKQKKLKENQVEEQDVVLGIRPEHMEFCENKEEAQLSALVDVSELMGSSIHLHVNVNGKDAVVIVPTLGLSKMGRDSMQSGGEVHFTIDGRVLQLFHKETTESLFA